MIEQVSLGSVDPGRLKAEADRCRILARGFANQSTVDMLNRMAASFEQLAEEREPRIFFRKSTHCRGES